jgi:hypothetical protein
MLSNLLSMCPPRYSSGMRYGPANVNGLCAKDFYLLVLLCEAARSECQYHGSKTERTGPCRAVIPLRSTR